MDDELIGATVGHCVIEQLIGQGGMARVYKGKQERLDRVVAVKILPSYYAADPDFVGRFKLEAKAMARLSHPHIIIVHDTGEDDGHLYIVMEYASGGTLKRLMEEKGMPIQEVARIIREVAEALTYAHSTGIVHRDVKPANVLMDSNKRSVLSDFGIAKMVETSATLTRAGAGVGTPEYMSPEQCRGGPVDARADIYALGVMLFEMLTGHTPFEADNYTALAHAHIYEPVPLPSRLNPHVSIAVQSVVLKALQKNPADRFQKATEMAVALDQAVAAQVPVSAGVPQSAAQPAGGPPSYYPGAAYPAVYCPRCRQANAPQAQVCVYCHTPLAGSQPLPGAYAPPQQTNWVTCPNPQCRAPNKPGDRFCTSCGTGLYAPPASIQCRTCGAWNSAVQRFCTACGTPLR